MFDQTCARLKTHPQFGQSLRARVPADFAGSLDFVAIGALLALAWRAPPIAFAWLAVGMDLPGLPYLTLVLSRAR